MDASWRIAAVLASAAIVTIAYLTWARLQDLQSAQREHAALAAAQVAVAAREMLTRGESNWTQKTLAAVTRAPGVDGVLITDREGRMLAGAGATDAALRVRHPIDAGTAQPLGWVHVHLAAHAPGSRERPVLATGVGAALALAGLAFALLVGRRSDAGSAAAHADSLVRGLQRTLRRERRRSLELERARQAAVDASRAKSAFLAAMSHEMRTPMNSVLGYSNLLLKTPLNDTQHEFASTIKHSTEKLLRIIGNVLDLSKIEASELQLESTEFELRECIEDALALLAPVAHEKALELAYLISPHVPARLRGDPDRIRQVLINLVGNAVKFTPEGSVVVRCTLTGEDDTGVMLLLSVTDTGVGMDESCRQGLFRTFGSAAGAEGTGLGLAISRRLVQALGGDMGVESRPEHGSTFWFTVRCQRSARVHAGTPEATSALCGLGALVHTRGHYTRLGLAQSLAAWGVHCNEAGSRDDLLAELTDCGAGVCGHDVVIVDLARETESEQLVAEIRQRYDGPLVALVDSSQQARADGIGHRVSACLFKPVREHELRATLSRVVGAGDLAPCGAPGHRPAGRQGLRVLVAEDDEPTRKLLVLTLAQRGAQATVARNGTEVMQRMRSASFDAVLMDVHMPGLDGIAATRRIRAGEGGAQHMPIVALTADALPASHERLLAAGADDYLVKPVDEDALWRCLQRWTGRRPDAAGDSPAAEAASGDPEAPVPRSVSAHRHRLNERVAGELRSILLRELPGARTRIREALARANAAALHAEAHRLSGGAVCCELPALQRRAGALERAAALGVTEHTRHEAERLLGEMDRLLANGTPAPLRTDASHACSEDPARAAESG